MSLLRRAVDEYLKEHHPLWEVEDYLNMNMYLYSQDVTGRSIVIDAPRQMITSYTSDRSKRRQYHRYSESNLLQVLTSIINSL